MRAAGRSAICLLLVAVLAACAQPATSGSTSAPIQELPSATLEPSVVPTETPTATLEPTATPIPDAQLPDPAGYAWVQVADGFQSPVFATNAGDGSGRLFVIEQKGEIRIIQNGTVLDKSFLDIISEVGSQGNEQGLLGLAFHPNYAQNGTFYVNYTDTTGDTVIARFQVSADPNVADPDSEKVLLQVHQPYANHNGGYLEFGPDGYLYFGLGDGGSGGDPSGNGQSLNTYLGKILRIDVDSGDPYGIPADNPFANGSGKPEIWAYGLRNPWRFTFDRATQDLYIADVGQDQWEEVDFLPSGTPGGSDLGWNYFEGTHVYQGTPPDGALFVTPVAEYSHGGRCSITGGYVYRGNAIPAWQGVYLYGDFCSGEIFGLVQHADGQWENQLLFDTNFQITSFGLDETGEIYVVNRSGSIFQLQAQ